MSKPATAKDLVLELKKWGEVPIEVRDLAARVENVLRLCVAAKKNPTMGKVGLAWVTVIERLLDGKDA